MERNHKRGQAARLLHKVKVRSLLAAGYIRCAKVNLRLANEALVAENASLLTQEKHWESEATCQGAEKFTTPT